MFPEGTNWYKGNLHSHTTNSDGTLSPEEAVKRYRAQGYSFLCLSDHDLYTDYREQFNDRNFLILPGVEISGTLLDEKGGCLKVHHMNGILGNEEMQKNALEGVFQHMEKVEPVVYYGAWNGAEVASVMAETLKRHGCFITYNHPVWSRVSADEFEIDNLYHSLEIYNYNTVNESGTGFNTTYWDEMLRKGYHLNADASDDNHNGDFPDSFGGYIMLAAKELTHEHVLNALLCGMYYSTNGPRIQQITIKDNEIVVSCSPVERVNIIVGGYVGAGTTVFAPLGQELREAHYMLNGTETYIRIECVDRFGRTAWSNPYYTNYGRI